MSDVHPLAGQFILENQPMLATAVTNHIYHLDPPNSNGNLPTHYKISLRDVNYHLTYLAEALRFSDRDLIYSYFEWLQVLFANLELAASTLSDTLATMRFVLKREMLPLLFQAAQPYLTLPESESIETATMPPSFLTTDNPQMELSQQYLNALLQADRQQAAKLVMDAIDNGVSIQDVYLNVFQNSQYEIGRLWQTNQIGVAQEHYCTAATQMIMSLLYPRIFRTKRNGRSLVSACISSELHEIGARMVADFFEMEGWDTYYLGANVPAKSIIEAIELRKADVLAISATMISNIRATEQLLQEIRASEVGKKVKILVGGYPFNISPDLWQRIGADGSASNALDAVTEASALLM